MKKIRRSTKDIINLELDINLNQTQIPRLRSMLDDETTFRD